MDLSHAVAGFRSPAGKQYLNLNAALLTKAQLAATTRLLRLAKGAAANFANCANLRELFAIIRVVLGSVTSEVSH